VPTGAAELSADGPWRRVDSAPGITTPGLVYELLPKLWVYLPTTEDVAHGITWTLTPQDVPVIEAYLHARLVFFRAALTSPIDTTSPEWSIWFRDGGTTLKNSLSTARAKGWTADLDQGVVLQPQVVGSDRSATSAVVFDCVLDGGVFVLPDGSLAPGSTRGVTRHGVGYRLASSGESWIVVQVGEQPDACG
jgi:hypothetical protein